MDDYGLIITLFLYSQIIQSVGILGLTELSIKIHSDKVGLKYSADLLFLALAQSLTCVPLVIISSLILEIPFAILFSLTGAQIGLKFFAIYYRTMGFIKTYNMINSSIFNFTIVILLVVLPQNGPLYFLLYFSLSLGGILCIFILINLNQFMKLNKNKPIFSKKLFYESLNIGLLVIFNSFFVTVDQLLVGGIEGTSALASYKITLLIFLAGTFPHTVVNSIVGPKVARLCNFKKFKFLERYYWRLSLFQLLFCSLSIMIFFTIIKFFGTRLYPDSYMPDTLSFMWLFLASIAVSLRGISTIILIQLNLKRYLFMGQVIYTTTIIALYFALIEFDYFTSMPLVFTIAHIIFCIFILNKMFIALK